MSGTVLVGLDGSTASARALALAWDFARATGRSVRVLHTRGVATRPGVRAVVRRDEERRARQEAEEWIAAAVIDDSSVRWRLEVADGPPGRRLVAAAAKEEDCVLVVDTHEHHGWRRVLNGSISHYVLSHAGCPVMAVPPPRPELVTVYPDPSDKAVGEPHVPRF